MHFFSSQMLIFEQIKKYSYRDPAAYIEYGTIYLFFTLVENAPERQYFYVPTSQSKDFLTWTEPKILAERDSLKNYSSPGNVIKYNGEYYLCLQTYPREDGQIYGNENSRIFTMKSEDLMNWKKPALLKVKGDVPEKEMGRIIDQYLLDDGDKFICFYKQNGVSISTSTDLANWKYEDFTACGDNEDDYLFGASIAVAFSDNLKKWSEK